MRGRLIHPFLVELAPLDTATMASSSRYSEAFAEPIKVSPVSGSGPGTSGRIEKDHIFVRAQIEPIYMDRLNPVGAGNSPDAEVQIVAHYRDLERDGLIDGNGEPKIRIGDRFVAIYTVKNVLVETLRTPLFATEVRSIGFGLDLVNSRRNLLLVVFNSRDKGVVP